MDDDINTQTIKRLLSFVESVQAQSYQTLWEVSKDCPMGKEEAPSMWSRRKTEVRKILGFNNARDALEDLLLLIEQGWLVRDIARDGEPDFWRRQAAFVQRLAKARNALIRMQEVP